MLPYVDFQRMTASSVGRYWRQATPEQQKNLQEQFKMLLVRTYSGALAQVSDQTVELKPMRSNPDDKEVVVRTEVKGQGDPIQLDYRLEQTPGGWKIYDVNVLGVWLVQSYQNMFSQEIGANGIDGLISKLAARNKGGRRLQELKRPDAAAAGERHGPRSERHAASARAGAEGAKRRRPRWSSTRPICASSIRRRWRCCWIANAPRAHSASRSCCDSCRRASFRSPASTASTTCCCRLQPGATGARAAPA